MNERIKELALQATTIEYGVDNGFDRVTFDKEKFAELIVQECIDVVDVGGEFVSRPKMVERLKEHFGVEE